MKRYDSRIVFLLFLVLASSICSKNPGNTESPEKSKPIDLSQFKPNVSFHGKIVFQSDLGGHNEIYLLTGQGLKKLTDNPWKSEYPQWSPDGRKIAFTANPKGNYDIFEMDENGSNVTPVTDSPRDEIEMAWFPDQKKIAYTELKKTGIFKHYKLWMIDLLTKKKEEIIPGFPGSSALPNFSSRLPLMAFTGGRRAGWDVFIFKFENKEYAALVEGGKSCRPHFSPNGDKIAYVSSRADGKGDIWLMNPDGSGQTRLTERNETYDYFPAWSPDGKSVLFCSNAKGHYAYEGDWSLYLVDLDTKKTSLLLDTPGRDVFPDWH